MSSDNGFVALAVAVLTVSDTRNEDSDTSGRFLVEALTAAGHELAAKQIVKDDIYQIRAVMSEWIYRSDIQAVLVTGGTGFSGRDSTPEAVSVLFDKQIDGSARCLYKRSAPRLFSRGRWQVWRITPLFFVFPDLPVRVRPRGRALLVSSLIAGTVPAILLGC